VNGQRIKKAYGGGLNTFYFMGADSKTDAIQTSTTTSTYPLYGNDMIGQAKRSSTTWTKFYYLKDHLGNIRVTVNSTGTTVASADDFYPFGMVMEGRSINNGQADTRFKFTSKERDTESGYDYFGARYYDARVGRWMAVDALAEKYPDLGPYTYVEDSPTTSLDPNGKGTKNALKGAAIGATVGGIVGGIIGVGAEVPTVFGNTLFIPLEVAAGSSLGGILGGLIGSVFDNLPGSNVPAGMPIDQSVQPITTLETGKPIEISFEGKKVKIVVHVDAPTPESPGGVHIQENAKPHGKGVIYVPIDPNSPVERQLQEGGLNKKNDIRKVAEEVQKKLEQYKKMKADQEKQNEAQQREDQQQQ
jgi:RHS repeat-associated protein